MVFSSLLFLFLFLPITLLLYWLSPHKAKNAILFIFSLIFYAWGEPVYILLMIFSTISDYFIGLWIERFDHKPRWRFSLFLLSMIINISVLGFFKYYAFFAHQWTTSTSIVLPDWDPPLPIGISFYTFQTMSYIIDVYRREVPAQRNFITFGCYVAMFPQLVAGPIVRYQSIARELDQRRITGDMLVEGSRLFIIGLGKKVLLANNIGALWTEVQSIPYNQLPLLTAWIGIIAFAFQIYFDFSGYSDMARGLGKILGFDFPINFRYPYISQNITEFWRRWHMTLGSWFRDYVYIPLGGNRVGKVIWVRNLFIVWFLTGLWHGASWNFVLWGLYFGFILACEKLIVLKWLVQLPRFIRHLYTIILLMISWVIFSFESISAIQQYLKAMFRNSVGVWDTYSLYLLSSYGIMFFLCIIGSTPLPKHLLLRIRQKHPFLFDLTLASIMITLLFLSIAYLVDSTYNPFLYFRF